MTHTAAPKASNILRVLEAAWETIRKAHPEVAAVVVILASGSIAKQGNNGHHAPMRWVPAGAGKPLAEVMVAGEALKLGAEKILEILLHEAAHALCHARGIKDCSGESNRYHNDKFCKVAVELGLEAPTERHRVHGYAFTTLPEATAKRYARTVAAIRKVLVMTRVSEAVGRGKGGGGAEGGEDGEGGTKRDSRNGVVLVCPGCKRKLRQRDKSARVTVCAHADGEVCGIMAADGEDEDD